MNKQIQISIIIGALLVGASVFYSLVIIPMQREAKLEKCLEKAWGFPGNQRREECIKKYPLK